jgi:hypothetical protein
VQAYDRYGYVNNNPIRYNDPTGHMADDGDDGGVVNHHDDGSSLVDGLLNFFLGDEITEFIDTTIMALSGNGHYYETSSHDVCLNVFWINCTGAETDDYLSRWQYPGQLPWQPVQPGADYNVFPERFNGKPTLLGEDFPGSGAIRVVENGNTVTNVAYESHVFDGVVNRTKTLNANGVPQVMTVGSGVNTGFDLGGGYTFPGPLIDIANHYIGPFAFNQIDRGLLMYTTGVETWQYITHTQQPR